MNISFMAIGVAVIANFILGWFWYGPLFGKVWAKEIKRDLSVKPDKSVMLKGMLLMIIGNFLMAMVQANDLIVWRHYPGMESMSNVSSSFTSAFFIWLGYYVPTHIGATVWEDKSWKLTFINLAYHFATLLVAALILTHLS